MNRVELDYYAVLNVARSAKKEEVTLAYRKLAIRLNPYRDPQHEKEFVPLNNESELTHLSPLSLYRQWEYINMAYDVLGNDLYRAIYDRYGEAGLFEGILLPNGYFPPYQYHGDHMKVYHDVFGSYSPYANLIDAITNPPVLYSTAEHGIGVRSKDAPIETEMALDLEEVRFGSVKLMHVWRQEFVNSSKTVTEKRKKTLSLHIQPGTTVGTRFTFKEEGDQCPTKIPADIIFIVTDKPHSVFERRNHHDLVYKHTIDLCQALVGFTFIIETLDKRKVKVCVSEVVRPGFCKILPGEGLPKCKVLDMPPPIKPSTKKPKDFGDMIIEFQIEFPPYLNRDMRIRCREFFADLKVLEQETDEDANPIEEFLKRKQQK